CSREEHGGEKAAACTDWIRWWHSQSGWASEEISNARGKETPCHSGQRPPRVHSDPAPHPCSNWTWRKEPYAIPGTKNILDCKCKHCCPSHTCTHTHTAALHTHVHTHTAALHTQAHTNKHSRHTHQHPLTSAFSPNTHTHTGHTVTSEVIVKY